MKNMFKMNKKGFTLVELLAVIVILALLIVITANTVLPMMNKTKSSGMITYAEKVLSNAQASIEADKLTTGFTATEQTADAKVYKIHGDLTKTESYFGCVKYNISANTYEIKMYSLKDKLYLYSSTDDDDDVEALTVAQTTDSSNLTTITYTGTATDGSSVMESYCDTVDHFNSLGVSTSAAAS